MDKATFKTRLAELKAQHLPILTWRDVFTLNAGELTADEEAAMDKYFAAFVASPRDGERLLCIGCGEILAAGVLGVLLGATFEYGLAHGEGHCRKCRWPARANHYDVGPAKRFITILQYHPDSLVEKKEAAYAAEEEEAKK